MAADIDVRTVATFTSLPESSVNTLLTAPTAELVKTLLQTIEKKAKEYEQTKSQKVKLEVELETVVRTNESKSKVLQNSRDKALADVSKLREDLQASEGARTQAQSELERIQHSIESEATETATVKSRINSLEASHRDTLSLLDSKSKEIDRLSQDLTAEHAKVVDLRRQVSTLEQANQQATSAATSAKFKQASLENEIAMQKKSIDWFEEERKAKTDEYQKFRREKNARVAELQASVEQYVEQVESLRRSENALRTQLEDQARRNEDLVKEIQKLQEKEISDTESHRVELDSLRRLAELHKAAADRDKARVEELMTSLDEVKEDAAEEIGKIRAEIQEEHNDKEAAERRVAELESRMSELEAELHSSQTRPGTPHRETNGQGPSTPLRPGTPVESFTPRSVSRLKNGTSTTQLYSEYRKLEKELANERRANEQLQAQVESMIDDLEASRPAIEELRSDQARLQNDLAEMSAANDVANKARDSAVKDVKLLKGKVKALERDLQEAQQMVRDRNSQVRRLLLEQQAGSVSDAEYERLVDELEQIDQREMEHLSATQQEVNKFLIAFRNIAELQAKNEEQLKTIRNLAATLEQEAAQESANNSRQLQQDLTEAQSKIDYYQNEVNSLLAQAKTFAKERDMFRNMLTRRGHIPAQIDPSDFSRSMPLPAGGFSASLLGDHISPSGDNDYAKLLKDLQDHFDNYRRETATDASSLTKQVSELSQRNSQLQSEASRSLGQLTGANERYEMLQANYNMLKTEYTELQKRSHYAMEQATKQELRTQQAAEDLVEARGMVEGLRRESANLKAEKELWKSIEQRLIDDNESLRNDRSRFEQLNTTLQTLLSEKERDDAESRRRLQSQIESLESELNTVRRRLEDELEEKKQSVSRRTYEQEQSQKRIDDLVATVSSTREELAAVKTARDHLQARVDELTIELRSAEERIEVLSGPSNTSTADINGSAGDAVSREQELAMEVSELKRDLELKTGELARVEEQVEDYKGIAQSAEERLQQFTETNDEDKADLQAAINEKEQKIHDLEQRIEDISSELSASNSELSKLRDEQAESTRRLEEQRTILQAEINQLKESEEKALEQANFNLEASKKQAEIATAAQESYDTELLKHAEAAKNAKAARAEANQLRLELIEAKTAAETARADLQQKESSWADMEARLKQESAELKNRREEAMQQNNILHGQLQSLTEQISTLQQKRNVPISDANDESSGSSQDLKALQEVIDWLRREKEIVEVQFHLSTQEAKRLKQQLESTQSQLEDTRLKLDQQRRADVDLEKNAMNHNKLMETLNQMNLYRESSVTLRSELKQAQQTSSERALKVEQLEQEIIPLRARVAELEHMLELKEGQMGLLQKDRDSWQQRTQNILSKYDRVDPAELEDLKTKISDLEKQRDEAAAARDALQIQVDGQPEVIAAAKKETKEALTEQFKARDKRQKAELRDKQLEADAASSTVAELQKELDSVREQLEAANARADRQQAAASAVPTTNEADEGSASSSDQRVQELEAEKAELERLLAETVAEWEERLDAVRKEMDAENQARLDKLRSDLIALHEEEIQSIETQHQEQLEIVRSNSVPVAAEVQKAAEEP
ncbi:Protein mlp1, partial [Neophaeococcomyces mojaviensis]